MGRVRWKTPLPVLIGVDASVDSGVQPGIQSGSSGGGERFERVVLRGSNARR